MKDSIQIKFDERIHGYVSRMPGFISLNAIEEWKNRFGFNLKFLSFGQRVVLLVDTNQHQFESVQCLKSLRDFFTNNSVIQSNGVKVAFVQPGNFMAPHIKSEFEAYFESFEEAYQWLGE